MNVDKAFASVMKDRYMKKDLKEIDDRLSKASKGPWKAVKGDTKVVSTDPLLKEVDTFTESEAILDGDDHEILCSSEWLRCEWEDLEFMAHARQDVEKLLKIAKVHQEFVELVNRMDTVSRNPVADRVLGNLLSELKKMEEKHS